MLMRKSIWILGALLISGAALALAAAEVWTSDYKQWSAADAERMLSNSPWAAKATAVFENENRRVSQYPGGSSRSGGGGGWPGASSGGGFPGVGGAGGGVGGAGYPGSGSGRGRPRDTGDETQSRSRVEVLLRWDSALPVKAAALKQKFANELPKPGEPEYTLDKPEKDYVISLLGWRMNPSASGYGSDSNEGSTTEHLRNVLVSSTQLLIKNKGSIDPEDVKIEPESDGTITARFSFPRTKAIDLDDKEVVFSTKTSWAKIEHKFKLKDMVFDGHLAL